jgi:ATP-binding cassette subfamily B (MDR/TAP) protein 9
LLSFSEWWNEGLRTRDRRADAKKEREERERKAKGLKATDSSAPGGKHDKTVSLTEFVSLMFQMLQPYRVMFGFGVLTLFAAAGTELVLPHYTAKTIFSVQKGNAAHFYQCVKTLIVLAFAYSITASARGMTFGFLNQRFVYLLRSKLFKNILDQDITFHDQADVGVLTSRLTSDCSSMSRILGMNINLLIRNVFKTIGGAAYLWILSPHFFATTALSLTLVLIINFNYGKYSRKAAATEQEQLALGNQIATEVLSLIRTVRIFGSERSEGKKYVKSLDHLLTIGSRQIVAYGLFLTSASFLSNATEAICLLIGGMRCLKGEISAEELTKFLFYAQFVVQSALASSEQVANINTAIGSSECVLMLLRRKPNTNVGDGKQIATDSGTNNDTEEGSLQIENFRGNLEFSNVNFSYPYLNMVEEGLEDTVASGSSQDEIEFESQDEELNGDKGEPGMTLSNINFSLKPGTVTALVGPSGGGKSTLVALLQYLYQPTSGTILADGVPIDQLDAKWYRSQIGYVEQEPKLFELPVGENIGYGLPSSSPSSDNQQQQAQEDTNMMINKTAVEKAAREANALEFVKKLPDYLDTWIGNSSLSGGQRQRIALARAFVRSPKILILDEATSALDAESEYQVQKALNQVFSQKDKSVLIIAHKLSTVTNADKILVLKEGKIVEEGTHSDLMALKGTYAKLASRQGVDLAPHCEKIKKVSPVSTPKGFSSYEETEADKTSSKSSLDDTDVLEITN